MHCAAKLADFFGIALIKIYLIGSIVLIFENRQKVLNHSNLFLSPRLRKHYVISSNSAFQRTTQTNFYGENLCEIKTCAKNILVHVEFFFQRGQNLAIMSFKNKEIYVMKKKHNWSTINTVKYMKIIYSRLARVYSLNIYSRLARIYSLKNPNITSLLYILL